jgi:hypothetical protein
MSSSTIIDRDTSPSEILKWIVGLWEKKCQLYSPSNVGSIIALNVTISVLSRGG